MTNRSPHIIFVNRALLLQVVLLVCINGFSINEIAAGSTISINALTALQFNENDTVKIKELVNLGYKEVNIGKAESAIVISEEAYHLSVKNSFKYGLAHSQLILAKAYNHKRDYPQALSFYIKCLNEFEESNNSLVISDVHYEIGVMYSNWDVHEKALEYFRISQRNSSGDNENQIDILTSMASSFESLSYHDSAVFYYTKVLNYYQSQNDLMPAIGILENIADINIQSEYYNLSIENHLDILNYHKVLGNINGEFTTLNNLGYLYKYINDFEKSLAFFNQALEQCTDTQIIPSVLTNIGVIYFNLNDYESSLSYMLEALKISHANKDMIETAKIYSLLASSYYYLQEFENAINYGRMAIEIAKKIDDQNLLYQSYLIVSNIYQDGGDFELALEYYKKYADIKDALNETDQLKKTETLSKKYTIEKTEKELKLFMAEEELKDLTLSQLLLEKEKREKELALQKENNILLEKEFQLEKASSEQLIQLINQRLAAEEKDNEISDLYNEKISKDYALKQKEVERKEQEREIQLLESNNKLLERDKQLDRFEDERNRVFRNFLVAAFLVAVIVLLLILLYARRRMKINKLLSKKNEEIIQQKNSIELQAKKLTGMNENLIKLNDFKQSLTGMIVHDLKNPLNSLLNISKNERVIDLANKMLLMIMNILDVYKFEDAALEVNLKSSQLHPIAQDSVAQVIMSAIERNIKIENNIPITCSVELDAEITERIFVNLLSNAIKFTPVNGLIVLNVIPVDEEFIRIEVSDTGEGIPDNKRHLVFEKFGQLEAKKIGNVQSTGLGLTFCKLAIEAQGGIIGVDSIEGEGATFWFTMKNTDGIISKIADISEGKEIGRSEISASSYGILRPYLKELQSLKYYQITELRKIISKIDDRSNDEIITWKKKLFNAINSGNKLLYAELTNISNHDE